MEEIKKEIKNIDLELEVAKDKLISQSRFFWVLEMIVAPLYQNEIIYLSKRGWTNQISIAMKFITREEAEEYIIKKDPVLIGVVQATEHSYY